MCRFSAIISTKPVAVADIVTRPRTSIIYQSFNSKERVYNKNIKNSYQVSSLNGDGYGVGWYVPNKLRGVTDAPNEPCIFVSARPAWTDVNLVSIAEKTASCTIFAHVRAASTGYVSEGSCHPFKHGRFMFMHNGMIGEWTKVRSRAWRMLPDSLMDYVVTQGGIDSAFIFAIFLVFLPKASSESHRPEEVRMAFASMIDVLIAMHVVLGITSTSMINVCLTDGETTISSRLLLGGGRRLMSSEMIQESNAVDASLYYASGSSWDVDAASSARAEEAKRSDEPVVGELDYVMTQKDRKQNTVIISSEPLSHSLRNEWVPVNAQHVLVVDKNCNVLQEEVQDCPWDLNLLTFESLSKWLNWIFTSKTANEGPSSHALRDWSAVGLPADFNRYSIYNDTVLEHCLASMNMNLPEFSPRKNIVVLEHSKSPNKKQHALMRRSSVNMVFEPIPDITPEKDDRPKFLRCNKALLHDIKSCDDPALCIETFSILDRCNMRRDIVVIGYDCGSILMVDVATGSCVAKSSVESSHLASIQSFIKITIGVDDRPLLLSSSADSTLRIWDLSIVADASCNESANDESVIHMDYLAKVLFDPLVGGIMGMAMKDEYIVLGLLNTNIYRIKLMPIMEKMMNTDDRTEPWVWTISNIAGVSSYDCHTEGRAALDVDKFWYTNQMRHVGFVECIVNIEGTNKIASAGADGMVIIWDFDHITYPSTKHILAITSHPGRIYALAHVKERNLLISGGEHGKLRLWDIDTGACLITAFHENKQRAVVTLSIHGDYCIIGNIRGDVSVLNLQKQQYICDLVDFGNVRLVAQNKVLITTNLNGSYGVLGAGVDGIVRVWSQVPHIQSSQIEVMADKTDNTFLAPVELEVLLKKMIEIKSISGRPEHLQGCFEASRFISGQLESIGCIVRQSIGSPGTAPVILARYGCNNAHPTLLLYGHYDVIYAPINDSSNSTPQKSNSPTSIEMLDSNETVELEDEEKCLASLWKSDPWCLVQKNGYYYGRGVCDNKGPICAQVCAVAKLISEHRGELGVNVVFMYEGTEEIGSIGVIPALDDMKELFEMTSIDAVVLNNATGISNDHPSIITSMRGVVDFRVEISGNNMAQDGFMVDGRQDDSSSCLGWHSGEVGGLVVEPLWILLKIISDLRDELGRVNIPGIDPNGIYAVYDQDRLDLIERELDKMVDTIPKDTIFESVGQATLSTSDPHETFRNTWLKPNISIGDIYTSANSPLSGADWGTNFRIMSSNVGCNISLRIVSGTSKEDAVKAVNARLNESFNIHDLYKTSTMKIRFEQVNDPWDCHNDEAKASAKLISAAKNAMAEAWGQEPLSVREGGTMAIINQLQEYTGAPTINIPLAGPGDNAHLPNERIKCRALTNAQLTLEYLILSMKEGIISH